MGQLDLRTARPSRSTTMQCVRFVTGAGTPGYCGLPVGQLRREEVLELGGRPVAAVRRRRAAPTSKPCASYEVACAFVSGEFGIDVGRAADALPVGHASSRAGSAPPADVEAPGGAAGAVVVAGHDDDGLLVAREVPEARERHDGRWLMRSDQVGEQPLLLVGLRDGDLVEVDPVRLRIARRGAEEQVVAADRGDAVALLPGPGRVALARVDDRAREVVGERGGLAAVPSRRERSVTAGFAVAFVGVE